MHALHLPRLRALRTGLLLALTVLLAVAAFAAGAELLGPAGGPAGAAPAPAAPAAAPVTPDLTPAPVLLADPPAPATR